MSIFRVNPKKTKKGLTWRPKPAPLEGIKPIHSKGFPLYRNARTESLFSLQTMLVVTGEKGNFSVITVINVLIATCWLLYFCLQLNLQTKWFSFFSFAQVCKQFFLSWLEKIHVTELATAKNKRTCREPKSKYLAATY